MFRLVDRFVIYSFLIFTILVLVSIYYINAPLFAGEQTDLLKSKYELVKSTVYLPSFYAHVYTSGLIILMGLFLLFERRRKRLPQIHKLVGKVSIILILGVSAPSGLLMSFYANGNFLAKLGFAVLAILWWLVTLKAFQAAKKRDWDIHEQFAYRSFCLSFAAILLRFLSFVFATLGYRGEEVYTLIVWLSWVPSLVILEIWLRNKTSRMRVK
ncbi:MAG: DUF2306 domain-containing protein [Cyclobacteriaceae bacterium]|nr:MAG: DUF2306 domain-containing protein [Cyclobacteriaceae bacterium]